jgi:uncharacterized protein YbcC (UPF0753/DUF2309 family)
MSTLVVSQTNASFPQGGDSRKTSYRGEELRDTLQKVRQTIPPVWPLDDFVAVNPFLGLTSHPFLKARRFLQMFSDCESLMPLDYYRTRFNDGDLTTEDIAVALRELSEDGLPVAELLTTQDIIALLTATDSETSESGGGQSPVPSKGRQTEMLSETYDRLFGTDWSNTFLDEVSRCCAAHYDTSQAVWQSPGKSLPLYQAWRSAAICDRRLEILGLRGWRQFVSQLPHTPEAAIEAMLQQLEIEPHQCEATLLCTAWSMPGWSSWVQYQTGKTECCGENSDFVGLLAIRLACDAALSQAFRFISRSSQPAGFTGNAAKYLHANDDSLARYILLRASEVHWRETITSQLLTAADEPAVGGSRDSAETSDVSRVTRAVAQMVFCIDVRSERFRRNLESVSESVQTFGFAGFFGVPIEFVALGEAGGAAQVPALLKPRFRVQEGIRGVDERAHEQALSSRTLRRSLRKAWKGFQGSASGCFGFVESVGALSGFKLLSKSLRGRQACIGHEHDGIARQHRHQKAPLLDGLAEQGVDVAAQAEIAASILKGIGITADFARLVVLCGHGSSTANNPLQAGLNCGACGGHSGEPNARFAAALLNDPAVRAGMAGHGIAVPDDVHFLAAVHNTTHDEITFFDVDEVPETHQAELRELQNWSTTAAALTRTERLPLLNARNADEVFHLGQDWSEVRPEWGLAGNAAFIAAPRSLTQRINLDGRSFLHSYDHRTDEGYRVLEQIMTAPLVVAHWINMQYYASVVDNKHFGSGTKTIHNVVGHFGVLSGNGGDLTTGLSWQSLHDGTVLRHEPLRLLAVIAAPMSAIEAVIGKHSLLDDLLTNDWLQLVAVQDGSLRRYSGTAGWESLGDSVTQISELTEAV